MPKQTETSYAVELPCLVNPRKCRLAIGELTQVGPRLYFWRKDAVQAKRDFIQQGFKRARVVKVTATFRWLILLSLLVAPESYGGGSAMSAPKPPAPPKRPAHYKSATITQGSAAKLLLAPSIVITVSLTNHLAWDYAQTNWTTITNFALLSGSAPHTFTVTNLAGKVLSNTFTQPKGTSRYLVVIAQGTNGLPSDWSNEIMVPPTNQLLTITTINATNLAWAAKPSGPWTLIGATNQIATNPPSPRYWRALGPSRSRPGQTFLKRTLF